jgi:hypothetical protein
MDFQRIDAGLRGHENHVYECGRCYTMKAVQVCLNLAQLVARQPAIAKRDHREPMVKALDALEVAKQLPPGPARSQAMKLAGRLRLAADQTHSKQQKPTSPLRTR